MSRKQLFDWRLWMRGLVGAVIGGGANAVTVMIVEPTKFNLDTGLQPLVQFTLVSMLVSGALYIKQSPIPANEK